jgi:drug/metabolite transporter (DMT)-like permease
VMTLPLALPMQSSAQDLTWLFVLGLAQLAVPCVLAVIAARTLRAAQISLLSQLEVLFGISLAWWLAGEVPAPNVLTGGVLVLGALVVNSWLDLRQSLRHSV